MNYTMVVLLIIGVALFAYLLYVLIRPEKF
ncbi:MAG TPA: K(+)-transporting ATPase subunit F [Thermodesulfobacteriota bacterium]|nr:K(+)-transporting ATPase subunit F [Thermodesulfobacteriota bacterium]